MPICPVPASFGVGRVFLMVKGNRYAGGAEQARSPLLLARLIA
jgi:hypothetical protein